MIELKRRSTFFLIVGASLFMTACQQNDAEPSANTGEDTVSQEQNCPAPNANGNIEIATGLSAKIVKKGHGRRAVNGDVAHTNVWLWLYDESAQDNHGEFIWESGNDVFQFQLGAGQVIKGWDLGVPCMLEGETRELVVAGDLAYGNSGRGNIPPDATLIFTIELLKLTAAN